jgi:hypothetical protein
MPQNINMQRGTRLRSFYVDFNHTDENGKYRAYVEDEYLAPRVGELVIVTNDEIGMMANVHAVERPANDLPGRILTFDHLNRHTCHPLVPEPVQPAPRPRRTNHSMNLRLEPNNPANEVVITPINDNTIRYEPVEVVAPSMWERDLLRGNETNF